MNDEHDELGRFTYKGQGVGEKKNQSAEDFLKEYTEKLANKENPDFRDRYRYYYLTKKPVKDWDNEALNHFVDDWFCGPYFERFEFEKLKQLGYTEYEKTETLKEERQGIDYWLTDEDGLTHSVDLKTITGMLGSEAEYNEGFYPLRLRQTKGKAGKQTLVDGYLINPEHISEFYYIQKMLTREDQEQIAEAVITEEGYHVNKIKQSLGIWVKTKDLEEQLKLDLGINSFDELREKADKQIELMRKVRDHEHIDESEWGSMEPIVDKYGQIVGIEMPFKTAFAGGNFHIRTFANKEGRITSNLLTPQNLMRIPSHFKTKVIR